MRAANWRWPADWQVVLRYQSCALARKRANAAILEEGKVDGGLFAVAAFSTS